PPCSTHVTECPSWLTDATPGRGGTATVTAVGLSSVIDPCTSTDPSVPPGASAVFGTSFTSTKRPSANLQLISTAWPTAKPARFTEAGTAQRTGSWCPSTSTPTDVEDSELSTPSTVKSWLPMSTPPSPPLDPSPASSLSMLTSVNV